MTPDEARALLDNFDRLLPFEAELEMEGAAKDMAAMIAGMRPQYRAEYRLADGTWAMYDVEKCDGWTTVHGFARGQAAELARTGAAVRIVRRYVTEPEAADATD